MKEHIQIPEVKQVAFVVAKEIGEDQQEIYNVYLINRRDEPMEQIIVSSKGYKKEETSEEITKTSVLRHHFELLPVNEHTKIEALIPELFCFTNEYQLTFWEGNKFLDKKFVFVAGSIKDENMIYVRELDLMGVVIE